MKLGKKYLDENNLKEAEKYLKISADSGDTKSQRKLGNLYYFELGKSELAEKGDVKSQAFLASIYNNLKKTDLAKKYYKIAADNGDISSQYYLACMYEEEGKLNLAAKYFLKVSQHKDKKIVEKYMTEEEIEKLHKLIKEKIVNLDDLEEK